MFLLPVENRIQPDGNDLELSYRLLYNIHNDLEVAANSESITISTKAITKYWEELKKYHLTTINGKPPNVKGLYLLYQVVNSLDLYNDDVLKLKQKHFKNRILFPHMIYILTQHCPDARKFLQATIRYVYNYINKKSSKIVNLHLHALGLNEDVIKHYVLCEFLSNALKKFNPLLINNINSFYRKVFMNIFHFFFMKKQPNTVMQTNFWNMENTSNTLSSSTRLTMYRNILYDLQVDKFYESSPVYIQLGYNYRIFRNIIINNELQDVYMSINSKDVYSLSNNEYKMLKIYDDDIINIDLLTEIKKLPTIFRLLKCVHLANSKSKPYNEMMINTEVVKLVIYEELIQPFKNMMSDGYLQPIMTKISDNFVNSILSGEYINLLTLTPVKIDQISFVEQLRQFVKLCINQLPKTKY